MSASRSSTSAPSGRRRIGDNEMQGVPVTRPVRIRRIAPSANDHGQDRQLADRALLRPAERPRRPRRLRALRRPAEAARAAQGRGRHADAHLAGVQLPRRRPRRPRRHLVRDRPAIPRLASTGPTSTAACRRTSGAYDLHFLHWLSRTGKQVDFLSQAELDGISAGDAPRQLRRSRLPRPPRVRDDRRVRRGRGFPRPRRQPRHALRRQLLLAHRPRERRDDPDRQVARARPPRGRSPRRPVHRERRWASTAAPGSSARRPQPAGCSRRPA